MAGRRRPRVEHKEEEDPFADFFKETATTHQHALAVDPFEAALGNLSGKKDVDASRQLPTAPQVEPDSGSGAPLVRSPDEQGPPQGALEPALQEQPAAVGEDLVLAPKPRRRLGQPKEEEATWTPFSHQRASPAPVAEEHKPAEEVKEAVVAPQQEQKTAEEVKEAALAPQQEQVKEAAVAGQQELKPEEQSPAPDAPPVLERKPSLPESSGDDAKPEAAEEDYEEEFMDEEIDEEVDGDEKDEEPEKDQAQAPQESSAQAEAAAEQPAKPELRELIDQTEKSVPMLRRASRNSPRAAAAAVQLVAGAGLQPFMEEDLPSLPAEGEAEAAGADAGPVAESDVRLEAADPEQSAPPPPPPPPPPEGAEEAVLREEDEADADIEEELEDEVSEPQEPPPAPAPAPAPPPEAAAAPSGPAGEEEAAVEVPVAAREAPVEVLAEVVPQEVPQPTRTAVAEQADASPAPVDWPSEEAQREATVAEVVQPTQAALPVSRTQVNEPAKVDDRQAPQEEVVEEVMDEDVAVEEEEEEEALRPAEAPPPAAAAAQGPVALSESPAEEGAAPAAEGPEGDLPAVEEARSSVQQHVEEGHPTPPLPEEEAAQPPAAAEVQEEAAAPGDAPAEEASVPAEEVVEGPVAGEQVQPEEEISPAASQDETIAFSAANPAVRGGEERRASQEGEAPAAPLVEERRTSQEGEAPAAPLVEDAPKEVLDEQREEPQRGAAAAGLPEIVVIEPAEAERTQRLADDEGSVPKDRKPSSLSDSEARTADGEAVAAAVSSKEAALREREGALRAREDALARREQALDVREADIENARRQLQEQLQRRNFSDTDSADAGGSTSTFRPAVPSEPRARNGRRPPPRVAAEPRLPNPDKVFSEKALEKRALKHYEHQLQKALASAQLPLGGNVPRSPVSLDKLPASTREHLLKSAREEAESWYQAEEQRARATQEQHKVQAKLQEWYEQREAARDAEHKRKTAEAEEAQQAEREERMKWQRRQEMLKRKVADWAFEKAEREEKSEREAEEANRAAQAAEKRRQVARKERMQKMLEQRYRSEEEA